MLREILTWLLGCLMLIIGGLVVTDIGRVVKPPQCNHWVHLLGIPPEELPPEIRRALIQEHEYQLQRLKATGITYETTVYKL